VAKQDADKVFFGAEDYYQWLKAGILAGDLSVMDQMISDVNGYAWPQLRKYFSEEDAEDVQQELDLSLWKGIYSYLAQSDDFHPFQRQRWLKTLIQRTIYQHIRSAADTPSSLDELLEVGYEPEGSPDPEVELLRQMGSQSLEEILTTVCSMRIAPDKMLVFFYHNIVFFLEGDGVYNGKPQETAAQLNGKTLGQLRDQLPAALAEVTGLTVDERLLAGLDKKLEGHRADILNLTPNEISVSTSNSKKRIQSLRNTDKK
jgi:DNA-directed RNA polymerase specialized sigma24 family protein